MELKEATEIGKCLSNQTRLQIMEWLKNPENNLGSIGVLCFKHKALYLFGYTNVLGRKYQANVAMLWYSILNSKENGFTEFDLGGFNAKTSKGIKKFKEGLNGNIRKTLGEYIYIGIF